MTELTDAIEANKRVACEYSQYGGEITALTMWWIFGRSNDSIVVEVDPTTLTLHNWMQNTKASKVAYGPQSFQGICILYTLTIIKHAELVKDWLWDVIETYSTNDNARIVAMGTPTDKYTVFDTIIEPNPKWKFIE